MDTATPAERPGDMVIGAYEKLRDLILDGTYHPGHRLTQGELTEVLGVGRTPLREALRMLQADGFLVSVANRGVTVSRIELGATEELYALRLLVEPPLLMSLAGNFSDAEIDEMEKSLGELELHPDRSKEFQENHLAFHRVASARYGEAIDAFVMQVYRRIVWAQRSYMSRPRTATDFIAADTKLLDALRRGDGLAAKQILEFHLIDAALGLILDVDPEHAFSAFPSAAHGIGIEIAMEDNKITPPSEICWTGQTTEDVLALTSANLRVVPGPGSS
ncbi:MAG TPA: GntR family transcriptional regulator [Solirubrobacterales bacterium]|nr:GntR family transcriptional regulator [Solirubrobacterales bacterium]